MSRLRSNSNPHVSVLVDDAVLLKRRTPTLHVGSTFYERWNDRRRHVHWGGTHGYWLDYGTLLGAVREGGIIPWEFDLDMGVELDDCPKFQALKEQMEKDGLHVYKTGDWVPGKENKLLGYDGFLHKACTRIYDENHRVYIDFDWNRRFTYEQAMAELKEQQAKGGLFDVPQGYTPSSGDLLCNMEAWESDGQGKGGCRLASSIFPLRPVDVMGVAQWLVNEPEVMLEGMYGPDWRTPQPKGYKVVFCSWLPINTAAFLIVWAGVSMAPLLLFLALPRVWGAVRGSARDRGRAHGLSLPNVGPVRRHSYTYATVELHPRAGAMP